MADESLTGRQLAGRFQVEKLLGEGAMGRVYRARHVNLDKIVAIKVLHPEIGRDPQVVERFQREARAASRLEHPHSLQVLDFGKDDEHGLFISMEFLDGRDVETMIKDSGAISAERAIRIMAQVLSALSAAHELGIVHRDMKPGNVMLLKRTVDDRTVDDFVKVCDFGLAKIASGDDGSQAELTKTGTVFGTPSYMSPEQARGDRTDARTDLYACGVILFKMITGKVPFVSETIVGTLMRHISDPVPSFESTGAKPDFELEAVVHKAMAKSRDERYASAKEMRADLLAVAARRGYVVEGAEPARASAELLAVSAPASEPEAVAATLRPAERTMSSLQSGIATPRSAFPVTPALIGLLVIGAFATFVFMRQDAAKFMTVIPADAGVLVAVSPVPPVPSVEPVKVDPAPVASLDAGSSEARTDVEPRSIGAPKPRAKDAGPAEDVGAQTIAPATPEKIPESPPSPEPKPEVPVDVKPPEPPDAGVVLVRERPGVTPPFVKPDKPLETSFELVLELAELDVTGGISKRRVETALERPLEETKACLRKDVQKVGREFSASISLKAKIEASGRLTNVSIESKLPSAEGCLKAALSSARLPRPDTGSVTVTARLRYGAKDER
ncbi:MAG: serine/threonine protein kinase [Deltaproteobacteria bacterium]|nr:serine/threonine protein kinase [Deltaproteobacteria bacterium]